MKSGKCPKCGSADVRCSTGVKSRADGHTGVIQIGGGFVPHTAQLDSYVCISCGYVESYISDQEKLAMIAERWPRAGMEVH
jgi:ssDNA-binding Zn-finger/Zn-ribbon topoisomerase 1